MTAKGKQIQEAIVLLKRFPVQERENCLECLSSFFRQKTPESAKNKGEIV